jgi:hypothetical protein
MGFPQDFQIAQVAGSRRAGGAEKRGFHMIPNRFKSRWNHSPSSPM